MLFAQEQNDIGLEFEVGAVENLGERFKGTFILYWNDMWGLGIS